MTSTSAIARPTISVIVAAYNAATTLERCLESIRLQTFEDFEVLIIDDGSSDATAAVANRYVEADARFLLFRQANAGLSATMNRGLELARGQYISFVDSDDYVSTTMYQVLLDAAREHDAQVVVGGLHTVDTEGQTIRKTTTRFSGLCEAEAYLCHVLRASTTVSLRDKLFHESVIRPVHFVPGRFYEDMDAGLLVFELAKRVFVTDDHHYYYVWHPGGITKQVSDKLVDDYADSILRTRALLQKHGKYDRLWLDFLEGVLARTVNFINQALAYAVSDEQRSTSWCLALSLVKTLDRAGILTEGTLRVAETRQRQMVHKYRLIHRAASDERMALVGVYQSIKDHARGGRVNSKTRLESSLAYSIARTFVEQVDAALPKGTRRRALVPAMRALVSRDLHYFKKHVLPMFSNAKASSARPTPFLFSVDGTQNFRIADDQIDRDSRVRAPDLSRFANAIFFYVEDASIASHINKWFKHGFFNKEDTLVIYRYIRRDAANVVPFLLEEKYHFIAAKTPQEHPLDSLQNVFYPFCGSLSNLPVIEASRGKVRHIGIGHGESDKLGSVYPQLRYFDHIFVSGQSAIDRMRNCRIIDDHAPPAKTVRIGLPFESPPRRQRFTRSGANEKLRILYAPTWNEEQRPGVNYCTVLDGFALRVLSQLVDAEQVAAVHFRPHPMLGWGSGRDPIPDTVKLLNQLTRSKKFELQLAPTAVAGTALKAAYGNRITGTPRELHEYDVVLCDISSVSTMALQARVPCIVMVPSELWNCFEREDLLPQLTITAKLPVLLSTHSEGILAQVLNCTDAKEEESWQERRRYVTDYDHPEASRAPTSKQLQMALDVARLKPMRDDNEVAPHQSKQVAT